ncbi:MAG: hypothetical protein COT90_05040 [Candidatus Diapherotrites archaeon CG10_big_fil_rev_8_21_14_0_10_31_34]|nr:MAG: hypothetical protein COT90_05040 [Candidatus Diapherotrites archaeon CG10_big_fil_rev_8_21_14_0_10_31_34]
MNKAILSIVFVLLLLSFGCTGITDGKKDTDNKKAGETIQEILAKGKSIDNIEYEMTITKPFAVTAKMYQKGIKYRGEASILGQTSIIIFDGTNAYTYDSTADVYYKSPDTGTDSGGFDFKDFSAQALADTQMNELGEETINGINTKVIEFSYTGNGADASLKTKVWISIQYGIPVKFQFESKLGEVEMEFKNIKIGSVQDSMFEVPEDKVKDMDSLIQEIPVE